ncbi:MAG: SGNH/GDSL hydrolase family protein [Gammaproteobacteria bacterium]|nr:SGNH/GDSL hydrolase family protein [Gammaproteobacteria bacterium]MDH3468625.1 SGNH/GDSL hydrolase family protein [Gammaproteobacteria bacterium]
MRSRQSYQQIVAFGDSMTDNGYDNGHGFQRYSNGRVWVEYLAEMLRVEDVEVYAWGGARSGYGNDHPNARDWSGLLWQIEQYSLSGPAEHTLFTVEIGINDLYDPSNEITAHTVVDNLLSFIANLIDKGARHLLVWNVPTTMVQPAYLDPSWHEYPRLQPQLDQAQRLYRQVNDLLLPALTQVREEYSVCDILLFDLNRSIVGIQKRFSETTRPWYGTHMRPTPGTWMWWDHWHWMTETHQMVADAIVRDVFSDTGEAA